MPKEDWVKNTVQTIFSKEKLYPEGKVKSILDVACGLSLKSQYLDAEVRVGVDIYMPYLQAIDTDVPYSVVNADVKDLAKLFIPKSFDLVLLLDILEHLEKDDALKLIETAEKIAKVAVIAESPLGYVPQNIDIWGKGGHEYQTHRSAWEKSDFTNRGYQVLLRDYKMSDVTRHTDMSVDTDIVLIDAIKRFDLE